MQVFEDIMFPHHILVIRVKHLVRETEHTNHLVVVGNHLYTNTTVKATM